jgi:hypothetical protein
MKWGIETFVRIIFKTVLLFLFFYAGYLVTERVRDIHYEKDQKAAYDSMWKYGISDKTRSVLRDTVIDTLKLPSIK